MILTRISFLHIVVVAILFAALIVQLCIGYIEPVQNQLTTAYAPDSNGTYIQYKLNKNVSTTWRIAFVYAIDFASTGAAGIICEMKTSPC